MKRESCAIPLYKNGPMELLTFVSDWDCDVVCASLYYIADPAIRVVNEKSVLRTFYLFKLASSSKLARSYKKIKAPMGPSLFIH